MKRQDTQTTEGGEQLWFFLRESMGIQSFSQKPLLLCEVRDLGLTLDTCLEITGTKGTKEDYAFYIHSGSMAAAVRLLSDESIIATYNLYCQKDDTVLIMIRGVNEPSPNSSRAPSHQNSLAERRKVSASRGVLSPELFIQPKHRHVSGATDISTLEPILDESAMVSIRIGDEFETFTKDYLLGWINAQVSDLKKPTDIVVQTFTLNGQIRDIHLTAEVWQHSLLRGPWKNDFAPIWDKHSRTQCEQEEILHDLIYSVPGFRQACTNFIHDLRTFGGNKGSRARLEGTGHEFYIGEPYFNDDTREKILRLPNAQGTLESALRALAEKRKDGTICAAHDLSPLFESALGLKWDKTMGKAAFSDLKSVGGLSIRAKNIAKKGGKFLKGTFGRKSGKKN